MKRQQEIADVVELRDRLRFNELQLERERANAQAQQSNLDDAKRALSMCEAEMDKQAAERRVEAEQLLALRQQIKSLNDDKQAALDHVSRELAEWKHRAERAEEVTRAQQADYERYRDGSLADSSKVIVLEKQLATTDRRLRDIDKLLHSREKELRRAREASQGVSLRERELESRDRRQQTDNKRLMALLARTMEYRALPHDATDSGGRVTYIGSSKVSHRAHVRSLEVVRPSPPKAGSSKRKPGTGIGALELQAWVPGEVADAALVLRRQLIGFEAAHGDLRDFLRSANRTWRMREKAKLRAQKQRYTQEIASLRRQISQRQPLVSVVHRVAGGYAVEPRYVEEDEQDYEIDTNLNRRTLFLEGAVWFGHRSLNVLDQLSSRVTSLSQTFTSSAARVDMDKEKLCMAFAKDLDAAVLRCRTKVHVMFDDALNEDLSGQELSDEAAAAHSPITYDSSDEDETHAYRR